MKLQVVFDVDVPTSVAHVLEQAFPPTTFKQVQVMSCLSLLKEVPSVQSWFIRNGYVDFDVIVTTDEKKPKFTEAERKELDRLLHEGTKENT